MKKTKVMLVEDDAALCSAIKSYLSHKDDIELVSFDNITQAKLELESSDIKIAITDIKLPDGSGLDLLSHIRQTGKKTLVVFVTGQASTEQAVCAMKNGALDFLVKPFQLSTLENVIRSVIKDDASQYDLVTSSPAPSTQKQPTQINTHHPKMIHLIDNLKKIAASKATVLIQGESGTGKEVLAHMVHDFSPRKDKSFIAINCAALPDTLLENELFGHEKGSFTGAYQRQMGKFELSDGGTILLDEISEMSLNMQTKLLRVLQECEIYRIGGNKPIPLNLRVLASTNRDLFKHMKDGHFREDLYYRINVVPVYVPALRERGDDVVDLAKHFLAEFAQAHERPLLQLDELSRYKILQYPWYGNVRELRNAMERAILIGSFDQIIHEEPSVHEPVLPHQNVSVMSSTTPDASQPLDEKLTLEEMEKRVIYETLQKCAGNRTRAAEILGISLRTLRNKLKAFRMEEEEIYGIHDSMG